MKMKRLSTVMVLALAVGMLAGCSGDTGKAATAAETTVGAPESKAAAETTEKAETAETTGAASTTGEVKVAFVVQDLSNESMAYSYRIMQQYAGDYGFSITAFDEANDPQKGVDAIGTCIAQGYDAIIVTPSDPSAIVPALMEAKEAGVIVGLFTSDLAVENQQFRDFFCGVNDTQAGETAAKALIDGFPEGCNVVEIGGQSGHDAQIKRGDGFAKGLEGSNINILATQNCEAWATEDAMSIMEDFITKYGNEIDAVFCHWDNGATGCINALQSAGMADVYVIGVDGCSAGYDQVIAGTQAVCIGQSFSNIVLKSYDCIKAAMNGETYEAVNWIPLDVVTADNVKELPYPEW